METSLGQQERPSLVLGDMVHVRFACMDDAEFAGCVVATEGTYCMLDMPKQFYSCTLPSPRKAPEDAAVRPQLRFLMRLHCTCHAQAFASRIVRAIHCVS